MAGKSGENSSLKKKKNTSKKTSSAKTKQEALSLPVSFDISACSEFLVLINQYVDQDSGDVTLNGGKVERITSPAIQLLLALNKTLHDQGRKLKIDKPSSEIESAFDHLGLSRQLKDWV